MSIEIETDQPSKIKRYVRIDNDLILNAVEQAMDEAGDEKGLPEGATLFLVTKSFDENGDKRVKRQAITPDNGNGQVMYLETSFIEANDGTRVAVGGRARKPKAEDPGENE